MELQALTKTTELAFIVPDRAELALIEPPEAELWQLVVAVADMIQYPVSSVKVVAVAGRFYFVDYQPYRKPDPSMVLMIGEEGLEFNRLIKRLIVIKTKQGDLKPKDWHNATRPYIDAFLGALERVRALPHERRLVMEWVTGIICQMR